MFSSQQPQTHKSIFPRLLMHFMLCSMLLWKLAMVIDFVINLKNKGSGGGVGGLFRVIFAVECGSLVLMDFDLTRKIRLNFDNFYYAVVIFHFYSCLSFHSPLCISFFARFFSKSLSTKSQTLPQQFLTIIN